MHRETHSFSCDFFADARDLEHNSAGLDYCDPKLRGTFTGTHTSTESLGSYRLIREDLDPDLTATLDVTGHSDTGCLDLCRGDPGRLQSLKTVLTVCYKVTSRCLTGHSAAVLFAVFNSLRK